MNDLNPLEEVKNEKGSALPYLLGWVAGVPVSLLLLVFLLRSIF